MSDTKTARKELQRFYALTDQLKVQLDALDGTVPGVRVEIRQGGDDIEGIAFTVMMDGSDHAEHEVDTCVDRGRYGRDTA